MELALNLAWLFVAGGLFAAFGAWRRPGRVALALVCVAALLFPIISMTDDFATAPAAVEAWSALRRATLIAFVVIHASPLVLTSPVAATIAQIGRSIHLACAGLIFVTALSILSPSTSTVWSFRAPPSVQL